MIPDDDYRPAWGDAWAARHLTGHDLACWCPLGTPCHADVLLTVLNRGPA